jgi:hypothetical protein
MFYRAGNTENETQKHSSEQLVLSRPAEGDYSADIALLI